jgi:serine/threonine-protein kinase
MALTLKPTVTNDRTWSPGTLLAGKYRVERVLGTGGMGVVVAAIHEQLEERVAVKMLRSERLAQKEACERVLREARATVKIPSDHVVRVFDVGALEDGAPYIVMEYLQGCDLAQLLSAEGKLAIADAAAYIRQACDAIAKAHTLGIVHRDLKPANLFLAVRDEIACIKVLDFGISKVVTADGFDPALTGASAMLGSPTYMSPEQIESPRDVDHRTDVWSLGVILYELVTGAHPFVGDTFTRLAEQITHAPTPSLRAQRPDMRDAPNAIAGLEAIVHKCLAKHRDDRYRDVAALAEALGPIARDADKHPLPAFARTMASAERVDTGSPRSPQSAQQEPKLAVSVEPMRSRWKLVGVAGVAVVATVAAVATFRITRDEAGPRAAAAKPAKASPLLAANAVVACPQLDGKVDGGHEGWLGAAAATIACTRAQARMGGHSARIMIPAELLDLPRVPVDNFPLEVFESAKARATQVASAKARGSVWLDGEIARDRDMFHVVLVLRASDDDRELARGSSDNTLPFEALRTAMAPVMAQLPGPRAGDRFLEDWVGARSADAAVQLTDIQFARLDGALGRECPGALRRDDYTPIAKHILELACGPDRPAQPTPMPARDTSSPAALRMSFEADPFQDKRPLEPDMQLFQQALDKTTDHEQRALLVIEQAGLASAHHQVDRATQLGLAALHEDPKALDVYESTWTLLSWLRSETSLVPAANAWAPWSDEAYCMTSTQSSDPQTAIRAARREHILNPTSRLWTVNLAEWLVAGGRRDEARMVATETPDPGPQILLAAADGKFDKAFKVAHDALASYGDRESIWAFGALAYLAPVAMITNRPLAAAGPLVDRYLSDARMADDTLGQYGALASCVVAPHDVATRCLARLRALSDGVVADMPNLLDGAEKYVAGDFEGAALAWQPMLARESWQLMSIRDVVADAFERAGKDDLVERVDARALAGPGRFNGGELAYARAARRAERAKDYNAARMWAQKLIDAWNVADVKVPVVAEMRKLVARLP